MVVFLFIKFSYLFCKSFEFSWFFGYISDISREITQNFESVWNLAIILWRNPGRPKLPNSYRDFENISFILLLFEKYFMHLMIWKIFHASRDWKNISCISGFEKYFMHLEIWKIFHASSDWKIFHASRDLKNISCI